MIRPRICREPLDIAVLFGGVSSEREISLMSGLAVAGALELAGHNVAGFDPAEVELTALNWRQFDACFIALHGGAGEDGRVQTILEALGVPYTGSDPLASRVAMSKLATKKRLHACDIATPAAVAVSARTNLLDLTRLVRPLGFPIVIKPDNQGCSLGVAVAHCPDELPDCLTEARRYGTSLLAERFIAGREMTVTIVDRELLPVLEIEHSGQLFDFEAKYDSQDTVVRAADADDPAVVAAAQAALAAVEAIDTRGLVRVDVMVDEHQQAWVLELNTVPGMTHRSLAPRAASLAGWDMAQLCDRLVRGCLASHEVVA
ncbi:MAG: D-alanine--D-alanine ligase [Planctomycetes bacterium]|nr:D-alanine--D-alanine ligase [Planctomycetota bacterium]